MFIVVIIPLMLVLISVATLPILLRICPSPPVRQTETKPVMLGSIPKVEVMLVKLEELSMPVLRTEHVKKRIGTRIDKKKLSTLPRMVIKVMNTHEKYIKYRHPALLKQAITMTPSRAITENPKTAPKKPRKASFT